MADEKQLFTKNLNLFYNQHERQYLTMFLILDNDFRQKNKFEFTSKYFVNYPRTNFFFQKKHRRLLKLFEKNQLIRRSGKNKRGNVSYQIINHNVWRSLSMYVDYDTELSLYKDFVFRSIEEQRQKVIHFKKLEGKPS